MKSRTDSFIKHESKSLMEKEFDKASMLINSKMKEFNNQKHEKMIECSALKGEQAILDVKLKKMLTESEEKQRELKQIEEEINMINDQMETDAEYMETLLTSIKEKQLEIEILKNELSLDYSSKIGEFSSTKENIAQLCNNESLRLNHLKSDNERLKEDVKQLNTELALIEVLSHITYIERI